MNNSPVIIIGAPRSGTNMLRDLLALLPGTGSWPCDEINYIWRHGNIRYPSDEFSRHMASRAVKDYILKQFSKLTRERKLDTVVEKTCANSLRVAFVDEVLPDARYIFILRDGLDVIGSAMLRWKAGMDIPYLARKARYVPVADFPYYASRYIANHLHRLISRESRLAFWGPQLDGMDRLLKDYSLLQVCALQWRACVNNAERDLSAIDRERIIRVRYEDFVVHPAQEFESMANFLGKDVPREILVSVQRNVSDKSVGKGREALGGSRESEVKPLIEDELARYGYHG